MRPELAGDVTRSLLDVEGFRPDQIVVVVNGVGGLDDPALEAQVRTVRLPVNTGPAGGFRAGLLEACADPATRWVYLCEDDVGLFALPAPRVAEVVERIEALGAQSPSCRGSRRLRAAVRRTRGSHGERRPGAGRRQRTSARWTSLAGGRRSCRGRSSTRECCPTRTGSSGSRTSTSSVESGRRVSTCWSTTSPPDRWPTSRPTRAAKRHLASAGPRTARNRGVATTTRGTPSRWSAGTAGSAGTHGTPPTRSVTSSWHEEASRAVGHPARALGRVSRPAGREPPLLPLGGRVPLRGRPAGPRARREVGEVRPASELEFRAAAPRARSRRVRRGPRGARVPRRRGGSRPDSQRWSEDRLRGGGAGRGRGGGRSGRARRRGPRRTARAGGRAAARDRTRSSHDTRVRW